MTTSGESARCPYKGIVQPSNMRMLSDPPLCLACAERLVHSPGTGMWRHKSDPRADSGRYGQDDG